MKYRSTRGAESELSFEDVLVAGYAKDRGLFVPEIIPYVFTETLKDWAKLTYPELAFEILRMFICSEEVDDRHLRNIVEGSFQRFSHEDVVNLVTIPSADIMIAELYHGPTMTLKDLSLPIVTRLLDFFMTKRKKKAIALVGTSGDTGSAAIESVRGLESVREIVLYPKGRISLIQELQMTTAKEKNVQVVAADGTSDDLDRPIKDIFADEEIVRKYNLVSMNSLNWARIMAQIPLYFYIYLKTSSSIENKDVLEVVVPTGGAGNITAGCVAGKMGLPLKLVAAVNENDVVSRTLRTGDFSVKRTVNATYSSAMDIQIPYNMERLLFLFSYGDTRQVLEWMEEFETTGQTNIPSVMRQNIGTMIQDSHVATNDDTIRVMKTMMTEHGFAICPHTAVAMFYHFKVKRSSKRIVMATASPSKFPEASEAAGLEPSTSGVEDLKTKSQAEIYLLKKEENWLQFLKDKIVSSFQ